MQKCTETWCPNGRPRPNLRKKVRSLLIPSFLQKKEPPRDGVGAAFGSRGSVSTSSDELAVVKARAGQKKDPKTLCRKMSLSLSGLFDKKPALDFIKSRIRRAAGSSRVGVHKDRIIQGAKVKARRIGNAYDLISKGKKTSTRASRAPPRVHLHRKKPVMLRPATKKTEGSHRSVDTESSELCKKRILMGRKCKPLNLSGSLQYDENGIPMPELLP